VAIAVVLVLLGLIAVAVRLDAPADGTAVSFWQVDGVIVDVPGAAKSSGLQSGDLVTRIAGHRLAEGLGGVARPIPGDQLGYEVVRNGLDQVEVQVQQVDPYPLLAVGWGNLIFVVALAALASALYLRRPEEPATTPLVITAAGLLGSTLAHEAGLPALALATGGPQLWLYNLNIIVVYAIAWGAALAFALELPGDDRWRGRNLLAIAYAAPPALMMAWMGVAAILAPNALRWFDLVYAGSTVLVAGTLVMGGVLGVVAYRRSHDRLTRSRLRWVAGGSIAAAALSIAFWHLPEILTGHQLLPAGALGLSALPFVLGIGVALRRHQLFDIEAATDHKPDVAVLDINMPDGDGLWVCDQLRAAGLGVRVLILTMYDDDENVLAALRAGAYGYTLKGAGPDELVAAVRAVARGEALFGAGIAARMLQLFGRSAVSSPFPQLTERETEVLGLLAAGRDNAGVARRLAVSPKTVRNHVSNIITKLHVSDRSGAILRARDAGLGGAGPS
jgi:DNA-binding NarL/FixJ family response regulator